MSRTVHVLPDAVANQIAAGEVVERPASVVKELVENALDAGASRIDVQIDGGGKRRIRVSDDGSGMGREDALLALDRHATSKIRAAEDLRGVRTFGFRGEALPSIASVSRLTLETRLAGDDAGTRIRAKGGRITAVEDAARTPGTTVLVEGLFFNAPARARFLGAPAAETRAVSEALVPLALANPAVALRLRSGDRDLLDLAATSHLIERVAELWGREAADGMIPVRHELDGQSVHGVAQRPDATRPGFRRAFLFVEGRPFREAALLRALDRGYRTTISPEHRPWGVLFLGLPRGSVDVNVHPTKAEVRFRDRGAVERLVEEGIRSSLEGEDSAASIGQAPRAAEQPSDPELPASRARSEDPGGAGRSGEGAGRTAGEGPGRIPGNAAGPTAREAGVVRERETDGQMALFLRDGGRAGAVDDSNEDAEGAAAAGSRDGDPELADEGEPRPMGAPRLWQVHSSWIMAEVRDGLLLIDQHAAHERILFERIMARFDEGGGESQRLLFPLTIRLTPAEYELVQDLGGLLSRAGFEVEGFGGDTVIVQAVPDPHPGFDAERCFREMIDELTHGSELVRSARNQHERVAMSFACKGAIKAGQPLDQREIQELFDQLFATELPFHDVHGRPTAVRLSRGELERKFGR